MFTQLLFYRLLFQELELKELMAKHRSDLLSKESLLSNNKDRESDFKKSIEQLMKDKEDLTQQIKILKEGKLFLLVILGLDILL